MAQTFPAQRRGGRGAGHDAQRPPRGTLARDPPATCAVPSELQSSTRMTVSVPG